MMFIPRYPATILALGLAMVAHAQHAYFQQRTDYVMDIVLDAKEHTFTGRQVVTYTNNSPDTLTRLYYHLYFNAFQPGSLMDIRSRTIPDPDERVGERIRDLKPEEIGFHKVNSLSMDGQEVQFVVDGTVLQATLPRPLPPGGRCSLAMDFNSQVPVQIRRSGRNNQEKVAYTMTQWYPKLAVYDREGHHPDPYVGREFYGEFGDFQVNITIDSRFVLGGTGVVQNADEVGHGYGAEPKKRGKTTTWRFKAENVHDFAWAADPDFIHDRDNTRDGVELHYLYRPEVKERWKQLQPQFARAFAIAQGVFGKYVYPQFSVIQGGDGGMEYPMCTMLTTPDDLPGLTSVAVHEALHNWYYGMLASNEAKHPWMDEGFTTYAQYLILDSMATTRAKNPFEGSLRSYQRLAKSGKEEPLGTHADHYAHNGAYGTSSYSKGCLYLTQLGYIMGKKDLHRGLRRYYERWRLRHPGPEDVTRIMEEVSGMELDWFADAWTGTTQTIDYAVADLRAEGTGTKVLLLRKGRLPMPLDVVVNLTDGRQVMHHLPLDLQRGTRPAEGLYPQVTNEQAWPWAYPLYALALPYPAASIRSVAIDPSGRLADVQPDDNLYTPGTSKTLAPEEYPAAEFIFPFAKGAK